MDRAVFRWLPLVALVVSFGCAPVQPEVTRRPQVLGAPMTVEVDQSKNPDVMWVVRPIVHPDFKQTQYGLFACYRGPREKPGAECHLAIEIGKPSDLLWPPPPLPRGRANGPQSSAAPGQPESKRSTDDTPGFFDRIAAGGSDDDDEGADADED